MRGTHWGKGAIGLKAAVPIRPPHATFFFRLKKFEECLFEGALI
jgi:hypothetical protein